METEMEKGALQKLMNNGVYGQAMENQNRIDVKLVSNKETT